MATILLIGGAIGAIGFVLVFLVDGATRPGYRPAYHPVSALSLGDRGWIQTTNFIVAGVLFLGAAIGLGITIDAGMSGVAASFLLGIVAIALIVSGIFPMDPMRGYPPGTPEGDPDQLSTRHKIHDAAGPVVFGVLPLACFAMAWSFPADSSPGWVTYSIVSGAVLIALLVLFGRAWQRDDPRTGLLQRAYLVVGWAWLAAVFLNFARHS